MWIRSLPYYGKKSILPAGSGTWVNSLLPTDRNVLYLEPFFGMGERTARQTKVKDRVSQ